jgi:hypothetical protein
MLKEYILYDGTKFNTVIIPKGTLLFRGVHLEDSDNNSKLFGELIGYGSSGKYTIESTQNVFFYPVPFVSQCVDQFNIHVLYFTNYDIELLLMIKPSYVHRGMRKESKNPLSILFKTCKELGQQSDDPCLTPYCIEHFPQIKGYIAIANTDKDRFFIQYKKFMEKNIDKLDYVLSSMCSNSRESIGIPEIVIHPLHLRKNEAEIIRHTLWNSQDIINYTKKFRAMYNFFPFLYISSNHTYNFNEIGDDTKIDIMKQDEVDGNPIQQKLFKNIQNALDQLLSPEGLNISGIVYKCTVDLQTGFYKIIEINNSSNNTLKNNKSKMNIFNAYNDTKTILPFEYPTKNKLKIMRTIGLTTESLPLDIHEKNLNLQGLSIDKSYIFDKGKKKYLEKYKINDVLTRPELQKSKKKINLKKTMKKRSL